MDPNLTGSFVEEMRERWIKDKWLRKDSRWAPGRTEFGVAISPPTLGYDACMAYWLNGAMPDLAEQTWSALRARAVAVDDRLTFRGRVWDKLDIGNYNVAGGQGFTLATAMHAAKELGDDDSAAGLERALDHSYDIVRHNGVRQYASCSLLTNGTHTLARHTRQGAMRDLIRGVVPDHWRTGPILAEAAYPDVLVARAVTDGHALELVLRPGDGGGRTTLAIERLNPGHDYTLQGALHDTTTAGPDGRALIEIELSDRLEVKIRPQA